jgi:ABC-type Na+ efflux pump permease subunit
MISFFHRIIIIGRNTLTEAVRQKVLSVLLLFALVLICSSVTVSQLATPNLDAAGLFSEQIKFVKDFGCGAIGLFGLAIALLSTALLIPQELDKRTIYTILAKPVRRSEFLLGKFFGVVLLLSLSVALMSLAFAATLYWQECAGLAVVDATYSPTDVAHNPTLKNMRDHDAAQIIQQVRDPQLVEAILLLFAKIIMTAAIGLLLSTFATSWIFTIISTFMVYLIGHGESLARVFWLSHGAETTILQSALVGLISILIPDMNAFTIVDEILAGNHIPWSHTVNLLGYANVYVIVLLAVSVVIFDYREL